MDKGQEVFYFEPRNGREIVIVEKLVTEEIDLKVKELNAQGYVVNQIFPITFKKGALCHEDEVVSVKFGFLCIKQSLQKIAVP